MSRVYAVHGASLFVIFSAAFYSVLAPLPQTRELDAAVGERVTIEGVVREPDVRENAVLLTTDTDVGTVLVKTDRFVRVAYGDRIRATGTMRRPDSFETDSGRTFNYPMYLYAHGVTHTMSFAQVSVLRHGEGSRIIAALLSIKYWFERGIEKALPEPESSLLAGLLVGEKRGLGDAVTESFRRAGLIHIIVLSGYNVALVINTVREVLSTFLSRSIALSSAGFIAILFMLMTGASETAIRATLMALVVLLAKALHRPVDGLRILLLVAAAMALWNPYLVLFDLSYQLSILATLGLILFSHRVAPYLTRLRSATLIEIVSTTIATQITVLPLLIVSVGQVSLVALVSNVFVLPVVPYAMLGGFVASLLAEVSPALAFPITAATYALLHYVIVVAELLGSLPYAALNL